MKLTKSIREQVALDLTSKAAEKAAKKLKGKYEVLNRKFWDHHRVQAAAIVPEKYWSKGITERLIAGVASITPNGPVEVFQITGRRGAEGRVTDERNVSSIREYCGDFLCRPFAAGLWVGFRAPQTMPRYQGQEELPEAIEYEAGRLSLEVRGVLDAAEDFYHESLQVLQSCTTLKQLEATWPEAAALVPKPEKPTNQLVDAALVESVKSMMHKGVPPLA